MHILSSCLGIHLSALTPVALVTYVANLYDFFLFSKQVSPCSPSCPGSYFVDQAGLELRDLPVSVSGTGIKGICHHAWLFFFLSIAVLTFLEHEYLGRWKFSLSWLIVVFRQVP